MSRTAWRTLGAVSLAGLCVAACGTQARWVNCDRRLEPINLPVSKTATEHTSQEPAKIQPPSP